MKARSLPPAAFVRSLVDYNPATGLLTWRARSAAMFKSNRTSAEDKARAWNNRFAGEPALSTVAVDGYLKGCLVGQHVRAHRVAWLIAHGSEPDEIDHLNGDRADNRLCNLRSVSCSLNNRNRRRPLTNKSGVVGVCWAPSANAWLAYAHHTHLGRFRTRAEAQAAREAALLMNGYTPRHGSAV